MIVKVTDQMKELLMNYVKKEPSINLFIIGDVEQFGLNEVFQDVYLQYKGEQITACVLRYYNNVILYSDSFDFDVLEIVDLINTMDYRRMSGKKSVMDLVLPYLNNITKNDTCYFCELHNKEQLEAITLSITNAKVEDLHKVVPLLKMVDFYSDNFLESNKRKIDKKAGRVYFLEENNEVVSTALTSIETSVSAMIGAVSTHNEHRKKGYASQVVSKLSKDLLNEGKLPCLFFHNPEAGKIYHRIGFVDIDMWTMLSFE